MYRALDLYDNINLVKSKLYYTTAVTNNSVWPEWPT